MTAFGGDASVEGVEYPHDAVGINIPAVPFAFTGPVSQSAMTPTSVASLARRDLVLDPAGSALDLRNDVLGCYLNETLPHDASAPHTGTAVTFENSFEPLATVQH